MPVYGQLSRPRDWALPLHGHHRPSCLLQWGCPLRSRQEGPGEGPQVRQPHTSLHLLTTMLLIQRSTSINVYKLQLSCSLRSKDMHILLCSRHFCGSVGLGMISECIMYAVGTKGTHSLLLFQCPTFLFKALSLICKFFKQNYTAGLNADSRVALMGLKSDISLGCLSLVQGQVSLFIRYHAI